MANHFSTEPMLEMYIFETTQLIEQLEQVIICSEKAGRYEATDINEIFRVMHTVKGSSAMMLFDNIAALAHGLEDVFAFIREAKPADADCAGLSDLVLESVDFIKGELAKIIDGNKADGDSSGLLEAAKSYLAALKEGFPAALPGESDKAPAVKHQYYISQDKAARAKNTSFFQATVFFQDGCEMENVRAYTVVHNLKEISEEIHYIPENILEDDATADIIRAQGFHVFFASERPYGELEAFFNNTIFLERLELSRIDDRPDGKAGSEKRQIVLDEPPVIVPTCQQAPAGVPVREHPPEERDREALGCGHQGIISVNIDKLDKLMDLVGELVIAEAMVTQNPDLRGLSLDNFSKAARQLEKITGELQDTVMSIRMVPLKNTFHKMHRIVRDMCKKLGKEVELVLAGEETEVDKNIIEHISDPLMHLIRNAIDHGIESGEERVAAGKTGAGKITLEAGNAGSDVLIVIRDDGRGLNREKILKRARENGLIYKPESELTDREINSFIFAPGFSTKDKVTEFSGRGVGMDVVMKNINSVGGLVLVDSTPGQGTTVTLKIPLTLAIIDGMTIGVGAARYTVPITSVRNSFRPLGRDIIADPDGNEMIMVRGQCYPILRVHRAFNVADAVEDFANGIIIMVENENGNVCLFADELIGQQQVVVKALPPYIKSIRKVPGLAGCTLLGDGSISLILDVGGMMDLGYRQ